MRLSATFQVGALSVTHLSDGSAHRPRPNWFTGAAPEEWLPAVGLAHPQEPLTVTFGAFLVRGDGHTTLVDTGLGAGARDDPGLTGGGELLERLAEQGVQPGEVDTIVQTHLHADHCGHLATDGVPTFPQATVYVHADELAYWTGGDPRPAGMAAQVREVLTPVLNAGLVTTFDADTALSEAMTVMPAPGHTPGHSVVWLRSLGREAVLLGDLAHHPAHLEHHDWFHQLEHDHERSRRSRARISGLAARAGAVVTAVHMPILTLRILSEDPQGAFTALDQDSWRP
jgi:glyoxylase-like metal-dependent hydrolase (beta-lactamase superfamily II)